YRVVMEVDPRYAQGPEALKDVYIATPNGRVPLAAIARYDYSNAPLSVNHQGQFAASTISFNLPEGVSLSQAAAAIDDTMARIGLVKKNAILMVDFALERERGGMAPQQAIYEACLLRFRPIMMTTMAALLGALPLVLRRGDGAELRQPLGIAIVGGLILSQLLTLYTTPVVYLYLDRFRLWLRRRQPALAT